MRRSTAFLSLLTFLALTMVRPLLAQEEDPLTSGIMAFRAQDFAAAISHFERVVENDPENAAQAHFLLARIYWEADAPIKDQRKAGDELDAALEFEPDNVQFLVAKLQQLRRDANNFFTEKAREAERRRLANRILEIDTTNAFAHEELGVLYIRDFWRYRNALMFPTLTFNEYQYRTPTEVDPMAGALMEQMNELLERNGEEPIDLEAARDQRIPDPLNPNAIFMADQFDVEKLKAQGFPVLDLSTRAQRVYDKAIEHLTTALESDPRQRSVYDHLMEVYSLKGEWSKALEMLSQMYVFFPEDAELWMYLGLAHHRAGNMDASSKAFETSFRFMSEEVEGAFSGLELILPDDEKKLYEEGQETYASRFWTSKDPRYLTPYNERKLEHYARLTYADLLYGSDDLDLRGWNTERGHILVRYGPPQGDVVIVPRSTSDLRMASPRNDNPAAEAGYSLDVARGGSDFDIAEEANTYNIWDYGDFKFVFEDPLRNGEFRMYSPSAADLAQGAIPYINDYTLQARDIIKETPERYEYEAPGRQIELPFLVSSFRGPDGKSEVYINYGIPITDAYDKSSDMINITANAGTFVVSENRDILVERRRVVYGLRTSQIMAFKEQNLWLDSQTLTTPPGNHEISLEFETTSGATVAVQRREARIHDFSGDQFSVSDLMLAYRVEESLDGKPVVSTDIVRNGLSIQPAPWSVFDLERPIYLYFETYNLGQDASGTANYEVEAVLQPKDERTGVLGAIAGIFGRGDAGVSVTLPYSIQADQDAQYLLLDPSNLEKGLYTLTLKVRDTLQRRTVERRQDLYLE